MSIRKRTEDFTKDVWLVTATYSFGKPILHDTETVGVFASSREEAIAKAQESMQAGMPYIFKTFTPLSEKCFPRSADNLLLEVCKPEAKKDLYMVVEICGNGEAILHKEPQFVYDKAEHAVEKCMGMNAAYADSPTHFIVVPVEQVYQLKI